MQLDIGHMVHKSLHEIHHISQLLSSLCIHHCVPARALGAAALLQSTGEVGKIQIILSQPLRQSSGGQLTDNMVCHTHPSRYSIVLIGRTGGTPIYLLQKGMLYQLGCMTVKIQGQSSHHFDLPFSMTLILEPQESNTVQKMILCSVTWIQSSEALYDHNVCISIVSKLSPNNLNLNQINPQDGMPNTTLYIDQY